MPTVQFASPLVTCPPKSHRLLRRFCRYRHLLFLSPRILVFLFHRHKGCLCSVQSLSHVQLFATPWAAALQASLSITNSWSFIYPEAILKGQQSTKITNIKDVLKRELPIQSNRRNSKEWSIPLYEIIFPLLDQHIFFAQHLFFK